jgi:hypothetical protein
MSTLSKDAQDEINKVKNDAVDNIVNDVMKDLG